MASRFEDASALSRPEAVSVAQHRAAADKIAARPLLGIDFDTLESRKKVREHLFYLFAKNGGALAAIYWIVTRPTGWVEWSAFALFYVINILSMSIGYHRFFTHRAFETSMPMRYAIAILAQFGIFGSLRRWVAEHRRHHALSDRSGDIHSPYFDGHGHANHGIMGWKHAHLGWAFTNSMTDPAVYGKGLGEDPAILFVDKHRFVIFLSSVIFLPAIWGYLFGGVDAVICTVLIAGFLRAVIALHAIACVNSFGHIYGSQRYKNSTDQARNNWLIALLTLGEGWHNNHHAHPRAANAGLAWYEIDMTSWIIRLLERMGLVWNVRWAQLERVDSNGKLAIKSKRVI